MTVKRNKSTGAIEEQSHNDGFNRKLQGRGDDDKPIPIIRKRDQHNKKVSKSSEDFFEAPTVPVKKNQQKKSEQDPTEIWPPRKAVELTDRDSMADPVVGWLVVIAGPGKGQVCHLGYGSNSLGRGAGSRVRLDFGDDLISREGHATVTYDSRGRKFYLQHGGGKNLTYLNDEPVLVPAVLEAMMNFSIGHTTLRFIPLCGPEFDWEDIGVG